MASRARSDIHINLPALKKLDAMLLVRNRIPASYYSMFCQNVDLMMMMLLWNRIYWITFRRLSFGMLSKAACPGTRLVLDLSGRSFSHSPNGTKRNGGCQFPVSPSVAYPRKARRF